MSAKANLDVLNRKVAYSGEGISVKSLETEIQQERVVQDSKVDELKGLRERNVEIQSAMTDELNKLRKFSDYIDGTATGGGSGRRRRRGIRPRGCWMRSDRRATRSTARGAAPGWWPGSGGCTSASPSPPRVTACTSGRARPAARPRRGRGRRGNPS